MSSAHSLINKRFPLVFLGIILLIVFFQSVFWRSGPRAKPKPPAPPAQCFGEPIAVDYPYVDGFMEPHECIVQCDKRDGIWRYILYSNGKATQCERPPGCLDWGEDNRVTCIPPKS